MKQIPRTCTFVIAKTRRVVRNPVIAAKIIAKTAFYMTPVFLDDFCINHTPLSLEEVGKIISDTTIINALETTLKTLTNF